MRGGRGKRARRATGEREFIAAEEDFTVMDTTEEKPVARPKRSPPSTIMPPPPTKTSEYRLQ